MSLESLGADAFVRSALEPYAAKGLVLARVAISQRDHYRLVTEAGEMPAEPSGALWYRAPDRAAMPVTGDWVAARVIDPDLAIVEAVLPRRTLFSRRAAGRREDEQPVAANIDLVFLVCGLDGDFNVRRIERYLTLVAESGAAAIVILNKADVCADPEKRLAETRAVAQDVPVVLTSTRTPGGLEGVRRFLGYGRTVALLGSSGVGKSTIVNYLIGEDRFRTNDVRESDSRGRHTTTRRELVALPQGGALIDSPGMRELQLWAGEDSLNQTFVEIATACRFRNCSHSGEAGCAIAEALEAGRLSADRWKNYRKLTAEIRRHEEIVDQAAASQRKKRDRITHKAMRVYYRLKDAQ